MRFLITFFIFTSFAFASPKCSEDFVKKNKFEIGDKAIIEAVVEHTMILGADKVQFDGYFVLDSNCSIQYLSKSKSQRVFKTKVSGDCSWDNAVDSFFSFGGHGDPKKNPAFGKIVCNSFDTTNSKYKFK